MIWCQTFLSMDRFLDKADMCACIALQTCATDCTLLGCYTVSDDPISKFKNFNVETMTAWSVLPGNCTGMAGMNSFSTEGLDHGSIGVPANLLQYRRRSLRWWCQGTAWNLPYGAVVWTKRRGNIVRKVLDLSCSDVQNSWGSFYRRFQIRQGLSKRHPSSNDRRSNLAT